MIPDRAPSTTWCLSRSNLNTRVQTEPDDKIQIVGRDWHGNFTGIHLSRSKARTLAKRINQCLDATVKR